MIDTIIYFVSFPFNLRDYRRLGIEILKRNGFHVEVWDFSYVLSGHVMKKYTPSDIFQCEETRSFSTKEEILQAISLLSKDVFIILAILPYDVSSYPIYRIVSKLKIPYAVIMTNAEPYYFKNQISKDHVFSKLKKHRLLNKGKIKPIKLLSRFFNRIPYLWLGVRMADLALVGSKTSLRLLYNFPFDIRKTECLWSHHLDYDLYLENKHLATNHSSSAVFLDSYIPFHPDRIFIKRDFACSPEEYYPNLNSFFERVENETGCRVIIAAHPRAKYEMHPDCFKGRQVIRGKTIQLVAQSKFVITHNSAASNFAVLFEKPIVFITLDSFRNDAKEMETKLLASWFDKEPINIDHMERIDWEKELTVNKDTYSLFRRKFLKKEGTEELPSWQIFANYIKTKYNHRNL